MLTRHITDYQIYLLLKDALNDIPNDDSLFLQYPQITRIKHTLEVLEDALKHRVRFK